MDAGMLSLIGILLALILLVVGSFKGVHIMILGPDQAPHLYSRS